MDKVRYLTVAQYAKKMGMAASGVRRMITLNRLEGAVQVMVNGKPIWAIPENAPWPASKSKLSEIDITPYVEEKLAKKKPGPKPKG